MTTTNNNNKRIDSTKQYINSLQDNYSKINVVRVDLGYKKPYSSEITLDEATNDLNHMMKNKRGKPMIFKDNIGYVIKKEFTLDRGVHIHGLFIYDGQKVEKDAFKGDQIGTYWAKEITKGKGSYHNCNRNKYEENGIGMIDHKDSDKRKILDEKVISYLCKDEQDVGALKQNQKERAFTRGIMPKSKGNKGRPRG
ncbi:MAG: inovirus-type Gp2 protein [Campylobacterota bacterium]